MSTFLKRPSTGASLRDLYTRPLIYGTSPSSLKWSPDGSRLAFLWNEQGEPLLDLYVRQGSELRRVSDAASVQPLPVEDDERPEAEVAYAEVMATGVTEFEWVGDGLAYLVRGNLFLVDASGETRRAVNGSLSWGALQAAPDGKRVGFLSGGNVWTYHMETGGITQVTFFGREHVTVGGFGWSSDSAWISIEVEDKSMYETVKMPDYSPEDGVKVAELRRNNVGKPLSRMRIGIVPSTGGKMARIALGDAPPSDAKIDTGNDVRLASARWAASEPKLIVACMDKDFVDFRIAVVEPGRENEPKEIFCERMEPWAECSAPTTTADSRFVCFASYREPWRRVHRVPIDGGEPVALTPDGVDVVSVAVPKKGDSVYYTACGPYPTELHSYRVSVDGGEPESLSDGWTCADFAVSEDGRSVALMAGGVMSPHDITIAGERVTHSALPAFESIRKPRVDRMKFKNESDGRELCAKLILPADFDPSKRYPVVLTCVYAGQGKEGFGRYQLLDTYMANEMGYILVGIDLRASFGYGRDFFYGYRKRLGIIDAEECASCAKHLKTLPFVDPERIGMWGGSYGGFLTLMTMCNFPGVFHTGVSWKPVTDWRNYWDSYTCPRLGRPQDDPEVYKATSPVFHADGLEGNLLIIHGMQDDNVLFQDAAWMIQKLVEARKYFDLMVYPRDDHGLTLRHESLPDCMERIAAYFEEHMGVGPV